MKVAVNTDSVLEINIDSDEAFRILCKTLYMDFVLDEDTDYFVHKNSCGELAVYKTVNGRDKCVDDRGFLFVSLRNVAANMYPNLLFRNADYIYDDTDIS